MVPRVDDSIRQAKCDLGLFNLDALYSGEDEDTNEFAIGQNFIRQYNLTMKLVERQSSDDISLSIFIGSTDQKEDQFSQIWYMLGTGFALLGYVGCLSVTKFRRVSREKEEFEKIKNVVKDIPASEAKQRFAVQQAENDFIKGKAGGQPLNLQIASLNKVRGSNTPKQTEIVVFRTSQSFVEKRTRAFSIATKNA